MKIQQGTRDASGKWQHTDVASSLKAPLVLVFSNRFLLEDESIFTQLRAQFPDGHLVLGSTAGEITGTNVLSDGLAYTAIEFEKSAFEIVSASILEQNKESFATGKVLAERINKNGLKHVFVLSEGSFVNGSELINGLSSVLDTDIAITGGLCGDDARFEKTLCGYNQPAKEGEVVLIGLYGDSLEISFANYGGWFSFGPERLITKSSGNVLYELDHRPALDLYKKYLGDKASELPQAALLYPLSVQFEHKKNPLVRTILNIDEDTNAMVLAGDAPEGSRVNLMMATVDGIVDGASEAAKRAVEHRNSPPELAILVSCVGRKLVMHQRVEEELEEVCEVLGKNTTLTGFYSYGELAPFADDRICELHNQTMTLTLISE
ncbi:FIST signal transduction protein [Leeuwenhoekiella palythoae]|uniref:Uncharacterized conserved protein, contains FIST_N domain n=1 Tax=Leeuwenhoekiella palythoae TaxID=573501 RepID=A0A1M5YB55_9FLAO|nr:FIST N-terminal domain-containing protein [Leeuwenhoekiella palythoae]RXG30613.1 hypothetical protein DSM01_1364 [Leeuwenhoekiella palythoae]SHI09212.1 Uncharacterized conserved protein, contains FIST_N domain [Leeuwenhoekiella palythoae]